MMTVGYEFLVFLAALLPVGFGALIAYLIWSTRKKS